MTTAAQRATSYSTWWDIRLGRNSVCFLNLFSEEGSKAVIFGFLSRVHLLGPVLPQDACHPIPGRGSYSRGPALHTRPSADYQRRLEALYWVLETGDVLELSWHMAVAWVWV